MLLSEPRACSLLPGLPAQRALGPDQDCSLESWWSLRLDPSQTAAPPEGSFHQCSSEESPVLKEALAPFRERAAPPPRLSVSTTLHSPAKSRRGLGAPVPECGYRCARPAPAAASGPVGMPDREASQGPLGFRGPSSSGCPRWSDEEDPTLGPQSESEGQHRPEWTRHALSLGEARKEPCG